jgi:hypothetical protein
MKMIQSKDVPDAIVEPALATAPSIAILRIPSARLIVMLKKINLLRHFSDSTTNSREAEPHHAETLRIPSGERRGA